MEEAERIAREEHGSVKLAVISGEHFVVLGVHLIPVISDRTYCLSVI